MIPGGVSFPGTPYARRRLRCALLPGFFAFCWASPVVVGSCMVRIVSGCCGAVFVRCGVGSCCCWLLLGLLGRVAGCTPGGGTRPDESRQGSGLNIPKIQKDPKRQDIILSVLTSTPLRAILQQKEVLSWQ